jgi:hypothetical protein
MGGQVTSAASTDPLDWQAEAERLLKDMPTWVLLAIAGAVLITVLIAGFLVLSRTSKRKAESDKNHEAAVAVAREKGQPLPPKPLHMDPTPLLGGIAVSLNGLWGFAQDTVHLSFFFAIGFVTMFDVLEMRLFSIMYEMANADPKRRWTRQLRVMRGTAWAFVFASAAVNVAHAPNVYSAPFLAIMPIGAGWVIYMPLKNALDGGEEEDTKRPEGKKPGPFRLAGLLWGRLWAWAFRKGGLDVNDRADEMVRRARAREAADASYALRKALKEKKKLENVVGDAIVPRRRGNVSAEQKRLAELNSQLEKKIRPKAQAALEMADTQDPEQGLQLMQRMAWLTRADDVALLDYGPDSTAMELLEQLNIAANAEFIKSSKRARDAQSLAAEAEKNRQAADAAVEEAQTKLRELTEQLERSQEEARKSAESAAEEVETEERKLQTLREERELLETSGASAGQLYQKTSQELEQIRGQLTDAQSEAQRAREDVVRLQGEQQALQGRLQTVVEERNRVAREASDSAEEAREAREQSLRLEERLAALDAQLKQSAGAAAKAQKAPGRVDARIDAGSDGQGGSRRSRAETQQHLRQLLDQMDPEVRERATGTSRRELARVLIAEFSLDLGEDAVRSHLKDIEDEDTQRQGGEVPAPRSDGDQVETEHEKATA